jgi:DNA-binding NarL/FixJ family response regulator
MIRVVLADDHNLIRQGIRALLEEAKGIQVVGEADNGHDAVKLVEQLNPDVLLIDITMPRLNGLEAAERIRLQYLATRVLILSMSSDETLVRQALRNGARGYLVKQAAVDELLVALHAVNQGETYLSPAVSATIVNDLLSLPAGATAGGLARLSSREREVLQLIAEGMTSREIGELLTITVKTVEKHRSSLMSKLSVHDVAGLTRLAVKYGIVSADS